MAETTEVPTTAPTISAAALGEIVTISIGPGSDKKVYKVWKDLICYHSEYFRAAYNGQWKEAEEGVTLDDIEFEVFNVFLHWIYTQQLPENCTKLMTLSTQVRPLDDSYGACGILLVKCCVFGDRFLAPGFRQIAHNVCVNLYQGPPCYEYIIFAFKNLKEDDKLLAFLVDSHCIHWTPDMDDEEEKLLRPRLPNSFLVQVMLKYCEWKERRSNTQSLNTCSYHIHESDAERSACPYKEEEEEVEI